VLIRNIGLEQGDPDMGQVLANRLTQLGDEGLPEGEFWDAFIQCFRCKWVMLRSKFPHEHSCLKRRRLQHRASGPGATANDIIDLTSDGGYDTDPNEAILAQDAEEVQNTLVV
jgi:hypothetical protein